MEKATYHMNAYTDASLRGLPNYLGPRMPIPSNLNIGAWRRLLHSYEDRAICDYLEFRWPVGYSAGELPVPTANNHKSALDNPDAVQLFIDKECKASAMLGPFSLPPFQPWCQLSPLMTRPKKGDAGVRVIIDLSFPPGKGVNAGIQKNIYEGQYREYTLPAVSDLADLVKYLGQGCMMLKCDLARAYRQL